MCVRLWYIGFGFVPIGVSVVADEADKKDSRILGTAGVFDVIQPRVHLWKTPDGEPFADIVTEGVRASYPVRSEKFSAWIYGECGVRHPSKIPAMAAIEHAIAWASGQALSRGPTFEANYRVASKADTITYDLANEACEVVECYEGAWRVVRASSDCPRFIRPQGHMPQVTPVPTDRSVVEELRPFIPVKREQDLELLAAWIVGCFKPGGPFPVLIINGEQGSAKSTTTRVLRKLVDPNSRDICEPPTNNRDFVAVVKNGYVLAVDNLSGLPAWLSDQLCRLATGTGAIGGRALYTNTDLASFVACRPIILNGIPSFVEREDLSDRSIHLVLPEIPPEKRRDDDTFWAEFNKALPRILGAVFNAVAKAQAGWHGMCLRELPRMANFAKWAAAGVGMGFFEAYVYNRKNATEHFIEHNDVAQAIIAYVQDKGLFRGTIVQLLGALVPYASHIGKYWPDSSLQLRNRLTRIKPELRKVGIEVYENGREPKTGRSRIEIRKSADYAQKGYAVSSAE